jgi:hypothetical protein
MKSATCGFPDLASITGSQRLAFYGPTLMVDIGFDLTYHAASKSPPIPGAKGVGALVDTGATQGCIDATLAMQLKLPIVDQVKIGGVHGAQMMNMHMAQVYIASLDDLIWGKFIGADLAGSGQPHRAIIGRDFLRRFRMVYDGPSGFVTLEA